MEENWRYLMAISFTVLFITVMTIIAIRKERKSYKFKKGDIVVMTCHCYKCTDFKMKVVSRRMVNVLSNGEFDTEISNGYYCEVLKEGMKNKLKKIGEMQLVTENDLKLENENK